MEVEGRGGGGGGDSMGPLTGNEANLITYLSAGTPTYLSPDTHTHII